MLPGHHTIHNLVQVCQAFMVVIRQPDHFICSPILEKYLFPLAVLNMAIDNESVTNLYKIHYP